MSEPDSPTLPPHSEVDERGLLGCMIVDADKCIPLFTSEFHGDSAAFYDLQHRTIFGAIRSLFDDGQVVDLMTLRSRLIRDGNLDAAGGTQFLSDLISDVPSASAFSYFAESVRDRWLRRVAIKAATSVIEMARSGDLADTVQVAQRELTAIATASSGSEDTGIRAAVLATIDEWQEHQRTGAVKGLQTGVVGLDGVLRGLRPGQLVVIAARPGYGKSSLAMQIVEHVAVDGGVPAGVFSLEMSREELIGRMIAGRAGMSVQEAMSKPGPSGTPEWKMKELTASAGSVAKAPLFISDRGGASITDIMAQARLWAQRHQVKLLVVDYIGLVRVSSDKKDANARLSEVTGSLKALAKELKVPVIALSQLNRDSVKTGRPPHLHDLRDSGSIEQDADAVIMLHPAGPEEEGKSEEPFLILVRKNRGNPKGEIQVMFDKRCTRFRLMASSAQDAINEESMAGF